MRRYYKTTSRIPDTRHALVITVGRIIEIQKNTYKNRAKEKKKLKKLQCRASTYISCVRVSYCIEFLVPEEKTTSSFGGIRARGVLG